VSANSGEELMNKRTIVVCGGTGFIGRNLIERLSSCPEFAVIGGWHRTPFAPIPAVEWRQGDLKSPAEASRVIRGADIVIQAAASTSGVNETVKSPHLHITENAVMNSVLLRAAYDQGVQHFLFFSCSIMYPSSARPSREEDFDPRQPIIPQYFGGAWTKIYVEKLCEFYSQDGRMRATVIRHSNVYGPYDKYDLVRSHVFGATATKVLEAGDKTITVWGDGSEGRDFLYVSDLVDCVQRVLARQTSSFELINAGSGELVSVAALVQKMVDAVGGGRQIVYKPEAPTLKTSICLDSGKAKQLFGWEARTSIDQGIRLTLDWRVKTLAAGSR
jgi:GDP-L-fucose synthase